MKTEDGVVTREELIAQGCTEIKARTRNGSSYFTLSGKTYAKECSKCKGIYLPNGFRNAPRRKSGFVPQCKVCEAIYRIKITDRKRELSKKLYERKKEHIKAHSREYYKKNIDEIKKRTLKRRMKTKDQKREYDRNYRKTYKADPEKTRLKHLIRRARKKFLVDDLSVYQLSEIKEAFGSKCALTGHPFDVQYDHVIPVFIGHGGTTYGNIVPLSLILNSSKGAQHIFEWFEANRERFNLSQRKFDELVEYLAKVNDMTTKEYRMYVDWCFDNPRDIGEINSGKEAM